MYLCEKQDMSNITHAHISEAEFVTNEDRRLKEFAGLIRCCGQTPGAIALGCRLDKRTVLRALDAKPIKSDAEARIQFYIKQVITYGVQ